jgi:hypothetical protein
MRGRALLLLLLAVPVACGRRMREHGSVEPTAEERRALTPRDLTRSNTSYEEAFGADSVYFPRIFRLTGNTIGISLRAPAHIVLLERGRCGPVARYPGHELSSLLPAGFHYLRLENPPAPRCGMHWWTPALTVVAAELPMHGEVLESRARESRDVLALMEQRRDRWSMYAVYRSRDGR